MVTLWGLREINWFTVYFTKGYAIASRFHDFEVAGQKSLSIFGVTQIGIAIVRKIFGVRNSVFLQVVYAVEDGVIIEEKVQVYIVP
jgi:hypothetical protein